MAKKPATPNSLLIHHTIFKAAPHVRVFFGWPSSDTEATHSKPPSPWLTPSSEIGPATTSKAGRVSKSILMGCEFGISCGVKVWEMSSKDNNFGESEIKSASTATKSFVVDANPLPPSWSSELSND